MERETGGPAFPSGRRFELGEGWQPEDGMTLRDYMAAKALQGWLASYPETDRHPVLAGNADDVAKAAYKMADAMLNARAISKATGE
ncbi:hypothetical protein [Buttiauxella gaviniae]|uniref:hypothetical protein n=1 Tax=Buttiauxella gaviniae TaxID=82990 RepID=UPI00397529E2